MFKQRKYRRLVPAISLAMVILACSSIQINLYDTPAPPPAIPLATIPLLSTSTFESLPTVTQLPTAPLQPIPGLEGSWQQGARVFTILWQNNQYVVIAYNVAGSSNAQLISQNWDGSTLTWTSRSHPENDGVTYVVQSVIGDLLSVIWKTENGDTGPAYLRRAAAPIPAYEPLPFFDDFSDPTTGWDVYEDEYGIIKYDNGVFSIRTKQEEWYSAAYAFRYYEDVVITVDATSMGGPGNNDYGFGIGCKYQVNGEGYWFEILMSGYYYVGMWTQNADKYVNLLPGDDWRASNAIHTGRGTNHVVVTCNNGLLKLEVNGENLFQGSDYTFTDGDIMLSAISYTNLVTEFQFDNFSVTAP